MLVLTRGLRQALTIGNDITVTVLEIRGTQVRIGVQAPRDIAVLRKEVGEKARPVRLPAGGS
ncbi:MAG: carbon storage regulator [Pseudomonadota bacterium]|nr:carbon storage regulator [Pseudomonadota bacterium]